MCFFRWKTQDNVEPEVYYLASHLHDCIRAFSGSGSQFLNSAESRKPLSLLCSRKQSP